VFKTAQEIDQRWMIDLSAERQEYICQAQSLNVFLPGDVSKKALHEVHFRAWQKGLKSLYYCRSTSIQRADKVSHKLENQDMFKKAADILEEAKEEQAQIEKYEECLSCQ
jgi:ribonucleoside-diphosphate reductase alpha chain